ncbi:PREDICTED: glucose dehydrogenase [FAD, quinone]-like, partial [Dinoponera quadriceps]|uniref:Glucose dehydrogenase [FAD, quinone]-like n=1 Tax=Dinoponera quadriceps TaxID=609295 RepID=A0A6P3YCS7_DINQU
MDAARELNGPTRKTVNGGNYINYFIAPAPVKDGRRVSTAKAFLSPIKDRKNLYVMKNTRADAVLMDGNRAIGVRVTLKEGQTINVKVSKEVILSAGSIASPKLLMLSGIGPKQHLHEVEIPNVVDLPVGKNLHNHFGWLGLYLAYQNKTATPPSPTYNLDEAYQYLVHKQGILGTNGGFAFIGAARVNDSNSKYADMQFFHTHYKRGDVDKVDKVSKIFNVNDDIKHEIMKIVKEADVIMPMPSLLKSKSTGELRLRNKDPAVPVKIYGNSFSEQDVEMMLKTVHFFKKMLKTKAFVREGVRLHHLYIPD